MFSQLTKAVLIASALGITCPDTNSPCALACSTPVCTGSLNCSTNAACMVTCNGTRACSGIVVTGVSNNATEPTDYAVQCQGSSGCEGATFTAKPVDFTRFGCSGNYSCAGTSFKCASNNCQLVCDKNSSCQDLATFTCLGGPGKTCNVVCNGGCEPSIKVACMNYPCNVTITGNDLGGAVNPCPGGLVCGDGSCVAAGSQCPSLCIADDPCTKAAGNECRDVSTVGGPYNCTCKAAGYKGTVVNGLVQSCEVPVGYGTSMKITYYNGNACTGLSKRTRTYNAGCTSASASQTVFTKCTSTRYCQDFEFGKCASTSAGSCYLSQQIGRCYKSGVESYKVSCQGVNNGAGSITAGISGIIVLLAVLLQ